MYTQKKTAISNAFAAAIIVVVLVVAAAGTYFFVAGSGTTSTITQTQTSVQTSVQTSTQTQTSVQTSTKTSVQTSTVATTATNIKPNPNILTVDTIGQPQNLDPAIDYETAGGNIIQNVYENLVFYHGYNSSGVVPWLASSYTMSANGTVYTFQLRQGIKFTDGTAFNSTAVKFSILREVLIDDPASPAWTVTQALLGAADYSSQYNCASNCYTPANVNAFLAKNPILTPDPYTVVIRLAHVYTPWAFVMAFSATAIISPSAVIAHWTAPTDPTIGFIKGITAGDYQDAANPWALTNMVGTGPYELSSWDQATQTLILVTNPHYWGGPYNMQPKFPTVVIKGIDDANTRVLDCQSGAVDICSIDASGSYRFNFMDKTAWLTNHKVVPTFAGVTVLGPYPTFNIDFFGFNQKIKDASGAIASFQPFQDRRIREAISMMFNRTAYIQNVLNGFGLVANQPIPPGMFGYDPSVPTPTPNPTAAEALLVAAGTHPLTAGNAYSPSSPQTIAITYNTGNIVRQTIATLMAAAINQFSSTTGLKATVQGLPWPQFLQQQQTHQTQFFLLGWAPDYVDPDDYVVAFFQTYFAPEIGWTNSTIQAQVAQQSSITDPVARLALLHTITAEVNQQAIFVWTDYGISIHFFRSWISEIPNSPTASNIGLGFNSALYGEMFAAIGLAS